VKEAVFPFARFPGVDTLLGPEMKSTGEVMGIDRDFGRAFAKSQLGASAMLPSKGTVFISVRDKDKAAIVAPARRLAEMGFTLIATSGTQRALQAEGLEVTRVNKVLEGRPHIVDAIRNGDISLVINTSEGKQSVTDSFSLRRAALSDRVSYYTTIAGARAAVEAISALSEGELEVSPLQDYFGASF
jgi:carbamoyl-phosphate synthase large subunit